MSIADENVMYVWHIAFWMLFFSSPCLLVAWAVAIIVRRRIPDRLRFVLVSMIVAIGLAPIYDSIDFSTHAPINPLLTMPLYLRIFSVKFDTVEPVTAAISFFATWGLVLLVGYGINWLYRRKQPSELNLPLNLGAKRRPNFPRIILIVCIVPFAAWASFLVIFSFLVATKLKGDMVFVSLGCMSALTLGICLYGLRRFKNPSFWQSALVIFVAALLTFPGLDLLSGLGNMR